MFYNHTCPLVSFRLAVLICLFIFIHNSKQNPTTISSNNNNCKAIKTHRFLCQIMTTITYLWLKFRTTPRTRSVLHGNSYFMNKIKGNDLILVVRHLAWNESCCLLTYLFGKPNIPSKYFLCKSLHYFSKNWHKGPKFTNTDLTLSILQFEQSWV